MDTTHDLQPILDALTAMTEEMQTRMREGDVAVIVQMTRDRLPLIEQCVALCEQLPAEQRPWAVAQLQVQLRQSQELLALGEVWLRNARQQILRIQRGNLALEQYHTPLTLIRQPYQE